MAKRKIMDGEIGEGRVGRRSTRLKTTLKEEETSHEEPVKAVKKGKAGVKVKPVKNETEGEKEVKVCGFLFIVLNSSIGICFGSLSFDAI